jgi:hypothetical protein
MTKQPTTRVAIVRSTAFLSVDAHRFRWARRQYAPSSGPKLAKRRAAELQVGGAPALTEKTKH